MSNFQNPITKTRLLKEGLPAFELEDILQVGSPGPSPGRPSSMQCEPISSHRDLDLVSPRLDSQPSRSITPNIDVVHPPKNLRKTELLDTKPGFFRSDNSYLSHWECCRCKTVHKITDKNKTWNDTIESKLQRLREADLLFKEPCSNTECQSLRCAKCFDLDTVGFRSQYCNRDYCERKRSPHWPGAALPPSPSLPVRENFDPGAVDSYGLMRLDIPPYQRAFIKECHQLTGRNGFVKEEFPKLQAAGFPRKPW